VLALRAVSGVLRGGVAVTCRASAAPPLPRAIRESPYVRVLDDGSVLVWIVEGTVECPTCHRAAAFVTVTGTRYACVPCAP